MDIVIMDNIPSSGCDVTDNSTIHTLPHDVTETVIDTVARALDLCVDGKPNRNIQPRAGRLTLQIPEVIITDETEPLPVDDHVSDPRDQLFLNAVADFNVKVAEDYISNGVDCNCRSKYKNRTAVHELATSYISRYDHEDSITLNNKFVNLLSNLVEHGLDINAVDSSHRTALHLVSCHPDTHDVITALTSAGCDANICDDTEQTPLHKAVVKATLLEVRALIEGGANLHVLDMSGYAPLHLAVKRKYHCDITRALLPPGASPDIRDNSPHMRGSTPLHVAVKRGDVSSVKVLLTAGANVDLVDGAGQSAVHIAAKHDVTGKMLPLLLQHGGNMNDQDSMLKETPLHKALKVQMWDNIRFLCSQSINPNLQDSSGESTLHTAAAVTSPFVWTTLTGLGGDVWLKSRLGETPLDKALRLRNNAALTVMKDYLNTRDNR